MFFPKIREYLCFLWEGCKPSHKMCPQKTSFSFEALRYEGQLLFSVRDEKSQLMVGVRRANRQQTTLPSSVLSTDSMHIGILAAAAHAATSRSSFTIFYNPRFCPSYPHHILAFAFLFLQPIY